MEAPQQKKCAQQNIGCALYEMTLLQSEAFIDKVQKEQWERLLNNKIQSFYQKADLQFDMHYLNRNNQKAKIVQDIKQEEYFFESCNNDMVPITVFKPKKASSEKRFPLLIYTHGGPAAMVSPGQEKTLFALAAHLGFAVACPNYRGSNFSRSYGDLLHGNYPDYPVADLKSTIQYLKTLDWVDNSKIVLTGISTGTNINALSLETIGKDLAGVILSQGQYDALEGNKVNNPPLEGDIHKNVFSTEQMQAIENKEFLYRKILAENYINNIPQELPILLIHGTEDDRTSIQNARKYCNALKNAGKNVNEIYVEGGNHYLVEVNKNPSYALNEQTQISQDLIAQTEKRYNAKGIQEYLDTMVSFLEKILSKDPQKEAIAREQAQNFMQNIQWKSQQPSNFQVRLETASRQHFQLLMSRIDPKHERYDTLWKFIRKTFGSSANARIKEIIQTMEQEEANHPDHIVAYHAGNRDMMFLSDFYSELRKWFTHQQDAKALRILDNRFEKDLQTLLKSAKTQQAKSDIHLLNNQPGYVDQAIAVNWSLLGSHTNEGSSSIEYFLKGVTDKNLNLLKIMKEVFLELGLEVQGNLESHIQKNYLDKMYSQIPAQTMRMVQIFMTKEYAQKNTYLCHVGGEPWKYSTSQNENLTYNPVPLLEELYKDPKKCEEILRLNKDRFLKAYRKVLEMYGTVVPVGDLLMDQLQGRIFLENKQGIEYKFYDREELPESYFKDLAGQVKQDFQLSLEKPYSQIHQKFILQQNVEQNSLMSASTQWKKHIRKEMFSERKGKKFVEAPENIKEMVNKAVHNWTHKSYELNEEGWKELETFVEWNPYCDYENLYSLAYASFQKGYTKIGMTLLKEREFPKKEKEDLYQVLFQNEHNTPLIKELITNGSILDISTMAYSHWKDNHFSEILKCIHKPIKISAYCIMDLIHEEKWSSLDFLLSAQNQHITWTTNKHLEEISLKKQEPYQRLTTEKDQSYAKKCIERAKG